MREKLITLVKAGSIAHARELCAALGVPLDLRGADLSGANLSGARLFGADLSGANLSGARLFGSNLTGAIGLGAGGTAARTVGGDGR